MTKTAHTTVQTVAVDRNEIFAVSSRPETLSPLAD